MDTSRKTAMIVGILYVIGTVTGVLSVVFTGPILEDPDYLINVSVNQNQVIIGALKDEFDESLYCWGLWETRQVHGAARA